MGLRTEGLQRGARSIRCAQVALAAVALGLYLPGFWWGAPHASAPDRTHVWSVDSHVPLGPLAQVHNIVEPKPDISLHYPLMHSFLVSTAYTPYLGYLWLTGELGEFSGEYPFGLMDPAGTLKVLTLIANFISVLMGVGIVLAAYETARALWGELTGKLAAVLCMVSSPMFFYGRTANVDVPMFFFASLAFVVLSRSLASGVTKRRMIWLGVWAGLATATKEPAGGLFLLAPVILLIVYRREKGRKVEDWQGFCKIALAGFAAGTFAFATGSGLLIDPGRYFAHLAFARRVVRELASGQVELLQTFPYTWEGNIELAGLIVYYLVQAMTLPGLLLAFAGVLWTLRMQPLFSSLAALALTYAVGFMFFSARSAEIRYVIPIAFVLGLFQARALALAWTSRWSAVRLGGGLLAVGIVTVSLARGAELTYLMINDSRYGAGAWLEVQAQSGDRVAIFGPSAQQPPLQSGVVSYRAVEFEGLKKGFRDELDADQITNRLEEDRPEFVVIMPDYTSLPGVPHSGTCPPEVYRSLEDGSLGYRLGAHFHTPSFLTLKWFQRPPPTFVKRDPTIVVNPPIRIYVRKELSADLNSSDFSRTELPSRKRL